MTWKRPSSKLSSKILCESLEIGLPWTGFAFDFDQLPLNYFLISLRRLHHPCQKLEFLQRNSSKLSSKVIWQNAELGLPWTDFIFDFDKVSLNFFCVFFLRVHCPCLMLNVLERHFSKSSSKVILESSELRLPWTAFIFEFDQLPLKFFWISLQRLHHPCQRLEFVKRNSSKLSSKVLWQKAELAFLLDKFKR